MSRSIKLCLSFLLCLAIFCAPVFAFDFQDNYSTTGNTYTGSANKVFLVTKQDFSEYTLNSDFAGTEFKFKFSTKPTYGGICFGTGTNPCASYSAWYDLEYGPSDGFVYSGDTMTITTDDLTTPINVETNGPVTGFLWSWIRAGSSPGAIKGDGITTDTESSWWWSGGGSLTEHDTSGKPYLLWSGLASSEILITSPTNASDTPDFFNWDLQYSAPFGPGLSYGFSVYYSRDTGVSNEDYDYVDTSGPVLGGDSQIGSVLKGHLLSLGNWYAKAYLFDSEETIVASSSEVQFNVISGPPDSGSEEYETPPEVECGATDFICKIGNWFSVNIGGIFRYLFVPSSTVLEKYQTLWPTISDKVPIGYIDLIKEELAGITEGTGAYELPDIPFFATMRDIIEWILWPLFAFYAIKRISNMKI